VKRSRTLQSIELLERAAGAQLAALHARLLALRAQRNAVLAQSAAAKRILHARRLWSAFDCAMVTNHTLWSAAASSAISIAQRATLADGARFAKEKARWATARVGLARRAARAEPTPWPD